MDSQWRMVDLVVTMQVRSVQRANGNWRYVVTVLLGLGTSLACQAKTTTIQGNTLYATTATEQRSVPDGPAQSPISPGPMPSTPVPSTPAPPTPAPPTPAPPQGVHDTGPSISDDGQKVVWFHRSSYDTTVALAVVPFQRATEIRVENVHPHRNLFVRISGDGKHVFWSNAQRIWHASVEGNRLSTPVAIPSVTDSESEFALSRDGQQLIYLVAGPEIDGHRPGWRAVRSVKFDGKEWLVSDFLSPRTTARYARDVLMSADDQSLFWTYEGQLTYATRSADGSWTSSVLSHSTVEFSALSLSPAGTSLLAMGVFRKNPSTNIIDLYLSRRSSSGFSDPVKLLRREPVETRGGRFTADGTAFVEHFLERLQDGKLNTIGFHLVRELPESGQWKVAYDIARYSGSSHQCMDLDLSLSDSMVWTVMNWEGGTGDARTELFLRTNLEQTTNVLNLSEVLLRGQ